MDSGRRSFVGSLMALLLAPMAVGGCLLPRRKSRRLASEECPLSNEWLIVSRKESETAATITMYGCDRVLNMVLDNGPFGPSLPPEESGSVQINLYKDVLSAGEIAAMRSWIDCRINAAIRAKVNVVDHAENVEVVRDPTGCSKIVAFSMKVA